LQTPLAKNIIFLNGYGSLSALAGSRLRIVAILRKKSTDLNAPIAGLSGLVEFSASEYAAMSGRVFEGENIATAPGEPISVTPVR